MKNNAIKNINDFPSFAHFKKQTRTQLEASRSFFLMEDYEIIVFSHLRWDFVFQRPQHIIGRLAQTKKVLFVEEPVQGAKETVLYFPSKNIAVLQPNIVWDNLAMELAPLVEEAASELEFKNPILWFYSAGFAGVIPYMHNYSLIVYDCMDELSAFKGANADMHTKEQMLLSHADIVFTGGKSLYESKKQIHQNVFCFPSSVEREHFEPALNKEFKVPKDIAGIPRPIVGFYGVLDERLDTELLKQLSEARPEYSFVLIGPVVKISKEDLPQAPNIYYLGEKKYKDLPAYLQEFDIAFMPFALNASTKFISPTKTLEFMAAGKPIVSTAIYDVARDYEREVFVAKTMDEFAEGLDYFVSEPAVAMHGRFELQQEVLRKTSWNKTVKEMRKIISHTLRERRKAKSGNYGYALPNAA